MSKKYLEEILTDINQYINIDKDRQLYASHFETVRDTIFNELRKNETFKYLFNGYQLCGSYGDNLKVKKPNEFDLVFHIKFPETVLIIVKEDHEYPGNVHLDFTAVINKIRKEKQHAQTLRYITDWVDNKNFLIINKIQSYIESCFSKVIKSMNNEITLGNERTRLRYSRQGPAHTVYVGQKFSVDFVPGVLLRESQSVIPKHVGDWEAIPKPIANAPANYTSFRSSFYRQEQKLINSKNNLKNALRIMKKFRDAHQNMNKMKSYFIKTLFLWKAHEKGETNYWQSPLSTIILDMFRAMEDSLTRKTLPFYWDPRLNMYEPFKDSLLREMLGCVQSTRKTLEDASQKLTPALEKRVYAIFLDYEERCQVPSRNHNIDVKIVESVAGNIEEGNSNNDVNIVESVAGNIAKGENKSSCVIS